MAVQPLRKVRQFDYRASLSCMSHSLNRLSIMHENDFEALYANGKAMIMTLHGYVLAQKHFSIILIPCRRKVPFL